MPDRVNGFNNRDAARISRSVQTTERLASPTLGGGYTPRRGGGIVTDKGTVAGQCKIMLTDNSSGWGFPFMLPMSS